MFRNNFHLISWINGERYPVKLEYKLKRIPKIMQI
jgi:hypothetical protein